MRQTGHFLVGGSELRPHDHVAYVGKGTADFSRLAMHVVASAAADERIVVCAETDWEAAPVLDAEIGSGRVLLLPVTGMYDAVRTGSVGAPAAQLRAFDHVVDDALGAGYAGVRVVADNTGLLTGPADAVDRWLAWEQTTDRWQAERPVTGVCYFAADQVGVDELTAVARRHPLVGGLGADPSWFVYHELVEGAVTPAVVGCVESFDADDFERVLAAEFALDGTDAARAPSLDLTAVEYLHHRAIEAIGAAALRAQGRPARLTNAPGIVARLCSTLDLPTVRLA